MFTLIRRISLQPAECQEDFCSIAIYQGPVVSLALTFPSWCEMNYFCIKTFHHFSNYLLYPSLFPIAPKPCFLQRSFPHRTQMLKSLDGNAHAWAKERAGWLFSLRPTHYIINKMTNQTVPSTFGVMRQQTILNPTEPRTLIYGIVPGWVVWAYESTKRTKHPDPRSLANATWTKQGSSLKMNQTRAGEVGGEQFLHKGGNTWGKPDMPLWRWRQRMDGVNGKGKGLYWGLVGKKSG